MQIQKRNKLRLGLAANLSFRQYCKSPDKRLGSGGIWFLIIQPEATQYANVMLIQRPDKGCRIIETPDVLLDKVEMPEIKEGKWFRLKLEVKGTQYSGYIDGKKVVSAKGKKTADHGVGLVGYHTSAMNDHWNDNYRRQDIHYAHFDNVIVYKGNNTTSLISKPKKQPINYPSSNINI